MPGAVAAIRTSDCRPCKAAKDFQECSGGPCDASAPVGKSLLLIRRNAKTVDNIWSASLSRRSAQREGGVARVPSPNGETLFVEHGAICAPQLDSPVANALTADGV